MSTHEETDQFWRDRQHLTQDECEQFKDAVKKFSVDLSSLPPGQFRRGLRVKPMRAADRIFEVTWEIRDGRATCEYGVERTRGDPHIIWRRIGSHAIFGSP